MQVTVLDYFVSTSSLFTQIFKMPSSCCVIILFLACLSLATATATAPPMNYTDYCSTTNKDFVYSSFHPWPKSILNTIGGPLNDNIACWYYADCIYSLIPNTRQQQYAATSLVMGLLPLILKDVAWPHRRIAFIPRLQPWYVEVPVRALGLNPVVGRSPFPYGKTFNRLRSGAILFSLLMFLLGMYAVLAIVELYSKRSALGCVVPIFILAWFIVALIPSSIEVGASRYYSRNEPSDHSPDNGEGLVADNTKAIEAGVAISEGIQGSHGALGVQFAWAIYYTAGTLVFSSIMLVEVLELFVWVSATCVATAASKMLAYKLCGYWGSGSRFEE
jgi:hypothetical protein